MHRPFLLLLCALLAATPAPPGVAPVERAPASAPASVWEGRPASWPGAHPRVVPGHAFDVAEADVSGGGAGSPGAAPARIRPRGDGGSILPPRTRPLRGVHALHLRDRAGHPAQAPPRRA